MMISAKTPVNQSVRRQRARPNISVVEGVADAADGADQAGAVAVHLAAKVGHVDVYEIGVGGVVVTPDVVENLHAGDDAALVAHEEFEKAELLRTELDDAASALRPAAAQV